MKILRQGAWIFGSDSCEKPQEYFVYFKAFISQSWTKRTALLTKI